MKEFENWWCDESTGPETDGYDLAQQAWRAALEWGIEKEFIKDEIWEELKS